MKTPITAVVLMASLLIGNGAAWAGVDRNEGQTQAMWSAISLSDAELRLMVGTAVMAQNTDKAGVAMSQLRETYVLNRELQDRIGQTLLDLVEQYPELERAARQVMVAMLSK